MEEKHFIDEFLCDFLHEFENDNALENHASCSVLEFENLFSNSMFNYNNVATFFECLEEQQHISELKEKILFLIQFEQEDRTCNLLHVCLDRSVSLETVSFLLKNGISVNEKNEKGQTPLIETMFLEKIDEYGEFYLDYENQIPLFTVILQNGGMFGLRDLSISGKENVIRSLKEREDLVTILKENEFQFTTAQKEEWNDIRLHFIC